MRGGVGRIAAMAIGVAVMLALALADAARAGTYEVAQCGWGIGAELDPTVPRTEGDAADLHPSWCVAPPAGVIAGMALETGIAAEGARGVARARWAAPRGTTFTAVRFLWFGAPRRDMFELAGTDDGIEFRSLAGVAEPILLHTFSGPTFPGSRAFEMRLECGRLGPNGCDRSSRSTAWLAGLTLTVADPVPPTASLDGALVGAGWHRGTVPVEIAAEDAVGSGVAREEASIDGAQVFVGPVACAVATIEGELKGTRLRPCPATATQTFVVDTTRLADGVHTLHGCAADLGGGQGCAADAQIAVDNSPPGIEFAAAPEGQVAATVSDAFSGPAAGTIAVRRADSADWSDLPTTFEPGAGGTATLRATVPDLGAGAYFFRATASDAVGNGGSAEFRASGSVTEVRRQLAGGEAKENGNDPSAGGADGKRSSSGGNGRGSSGGDGGGKRSSGGGGSGAAQGRRATTHLAAYLVAGGRTDRRARRRDFATDRPAGGRADRRAPRPGLAAFRVGGGGARLTVDPDQRAPRPDLASRVGAGGSRLTVDYGSAVEVRGHLTDSHHAGISGRAVTVITHTAGGFGGAPERRRVVTERGGRFALRLPPGTSRRVTVAFRGGGGFAASHGRPLALRVRAAVDLAAAPPSLSTGEKVHFVGTVKRGRARIPGRGKLVAIQYLDRESGRWRPALVIRTGGNGHFHADYRFRYITGAARIRFRAIVLPEAGWPYAPGSSAPVTVAVHGR
jgi:uncharacterized membrane protein YgcG